MNQCNLMARVFASQVASSFLHQRLPRAVWKSLGKAKRMKNVRCKMQGRATDDLAFGTVSAPSFSIKCGHKRQPSSHLIRSLSILQAH